MLSSFVLSIYTVYKERMESHFVAKPDVNLKQVMPKPLLSPAYLELEF